jgi:enamine deaminase RidA (YjgF/YER057c/UK114 family)
MAKTTVRAHPELPARVAPDVHIVRAGNLAFMSGTAGRDRTGRVAAGDILAQGRQLLENTRVALEAVGAAPRDVARVTLYFRDIRLKPELDKLRDEFFGPDWPAGVAVGVASLGSADHLVEMDAVAVLWTPKIAVRKVTGLWDPVAPYSRVVRAGDLVFMSGIVGADEHLNPVSPGHIERQFERLLANCRLALEAAGAKPEDVVRVTLYLTDIREKPRLDKLRDAFFGPNWPAAVAVGVPALAAPGLHVEMDAIAVVGAEKRAVRRVAGLWDPVAPYSRVVRSGNLVFMSGIVGADTNLNVVGTGDIEAQFRQLLENTRVALAAVGARPEDVVRVTLYMLDPREKPRLNALCGDFFGLDSPAAVAVGVTALGLPGFLVEMDAVAIVE